MTLKCSSRIKHRAKASNIYSQATSIHTLKVERREGGKEGEREGGKEGDVEGRNGVGGEDVV